MDPTNLLMPILDSELRQLNFINGRVLTAEEMAVEQETNALMHSLLGQAVGSGIVTGLQVNSESNQTVNVTPGLAIAPDGRLLRLQEPRNVSLVVNPELSDGTTQDCTPVGSQGFRACHTVGSTTPINAGNGAYLLLLTPAYGQQGSAVVQRLSGNGVADTCEYAYDVYGVKFRLVRIDPSFMGSDLQSLQDAFTTSDPGQFQNALAHSCLGTKRLAEAAADPFLRDGEEFDPLVDKLLKSGLVETYEAPLAVIGWSDGAIAFVDMWAVRRPVVIAGADDDWPFHTQPRRVAEGQAAFLQFQQQLEELQASSEDPGSVQAIDHFAFLPAAGYLPIGDGDFNIPQFFGRNLPVQDIDPVFINLYLNHSWLTLPLDLEEESALVSVFTHPDNNDIAFFMRHERSYEIEEVAEEAEPSDEPREDKVILNGTFLVQVLPVATDITAVEISERQILKLASSLEVEAIVGKKSYPGTLVSAPTFAEKFKGRYGDLLASGLYYRIIVPPGNYIVQLSGQGLITQKTSSNIKSQEQKNITFTLKPRGGGKKPPNVGVYIPDDDKYGKIYVLPDDILEEIPRDLEEWEVDPWPEPPIDEWVINWGEEIQKAYPDEVVNPADPQIYINPGHDVNSTPTEPYAYVEYGQGGAAVPLILTGKDQTLELPATLLKGDIAGMDAEVASRLNEAGIGALDMLAATPAVYTAGVLGIGTEAASSLGDAARDETTNLKDGLQLLGGVDSETESALRDILSLEEGQSPLDAMANISVDTLVEGGINRGFALRLVDEAQGAKPPGNWSLDDGRLNLAEDDRVLLGTLGINTKGQLLARENLNENLVNAGVGSDIIDRIGNAVIVASAIGQGQLSVGTLTIERIDETGATTAVPVTDIVGGNFKNVEDILTADRETLISIAGDEATADLIATVAIRHTLNLDKNTATGLVAGGINNAAAIAGSDRNTIAGIVGGANVNNLIIAAGAFTGRRR